MRVFPDFLKLFLSVCLEAAASSPRKKKWLLFGILSISMFTIKRWLLLKPDLLWSYIYVYIFIVILCSCSFLFIIIFKFYVFFTPKNPLGRMRIWALPRLTHPKMEQETNVRSSERVTRDERARRIVSLSFKASHVVRSAKRVVRKLARATKRKAG